MENARTREIVLTQRLKKAENLIEALKNEISGFVNRTQRHLDTTNL